jgi:glyoxylase-like metal-dependent hydrolase (beta-lactamase superfamily II)
MRNNTRWHGDHVGGNENLGKTGVVIVAHDNVRRRMSSEQFINAINSKVPPSPTAALDERWGKGFLKPDVWVSIVYVDLSGNK